NPCCFLNLISRAQPYRAIPAPGRQTCRTGARKPLICCFASAFVPISDENRDGGRAFPDSQESQLRFAVPARIALQGGERADSVANRPCPLQDESHSGTCLGRPTAPDPDSTPGQSLPGRVEP